MENTQKSTTITEEEINLEEIKERHKFESAAEIHPFAEQIRLARELLESENPLIGLCPACMNTGFIQEFDGIYQTTIAEQFEDDEVEFKICYHGEDVTENFEF